MAHAPHAGLLRVLHTLPPHDVAVALSGSDFGVLAGVSREWRAVLARTRPHIEISVVFDPGMGFVRAFARLSELWTCVRVVWAARHRGTPVRIAALCEALKRVHGLCELEVDCSCMDRRGTLLVARTAAHLTHLQCLRLESNRTGGFPLGFLDAVVTGTTRLRELDVRAMGDGPCAFTDPSGLAHATNLQRLGLSGTGLACVGLHRLVESTAKWTQLRALDVSNCNLFMSHEPTMQRALPLCTGLTDLNVGGNGLFPTQIVGVCEVLRRNPGLFTLTLEDNGLDLSSAVHLGRALRALTRLTDLSIRCMDIDNSIAALLYPALRASTQLQSLDISGNPCDLPSPRMLADFPDLRCLSMHGLHVDNWHFMQMLQNVDRHRALHSLHVAEPQGLTLTLVSPETLRFKLPVLQAVFVYSENLHAQQFARLEKTCAVQVVRVSDVYS